MANESAAPSHFNIDGKTLSWIAGPALLVIGLNLFYWMWFGLKVGASISEESGVWGTYGDFVGGIANPIVSLATLFIVIRAYLLQRQELTDTRKALETSAKEQSRMATISRIHGQIRALAAILERQVALRDNVFSEIQRLAAVPPQHDSVSFDGQRMTFEARQKVMSTLQVELQGATMRCKSAQLSLKGFAAKLEAVGNSDGESKPTT